jgi:hypothetical protein
MEAKETPLYTNHQPQLLGKLCITSQVRKEGEGDITVVIYEKCIV